MAGWHPASIQVPWGQLYCDSFMAAASFVCWCGRQYFSFPYGLGESGWIFFKAVELFYQHPSLEERLSAGSRRDSWAWRVSVGTHPKNTQARARKRQRAAQPRQRQTTFPPWARPCLLFSSSCLWWGRGSPAHSPTSLTDSSSLTGLCPRTDHFLKRVPLPLLRDEARSNKLFGYRRDGPSEARSAQWAAPLAAPWPLHPAADVDSRLEDTLDLCFYLSFPHQASPTCFPPSTHSAKVLPTNSTFTCSPCTLNL